MPLVLDPSKLNATFAELVNAGDLEGLMSLYEPNALHQNDSTSTPDSGIAAIEQSLRGLLAVPGRMVSVNNFTLVVDDIALLRADWRIEGDSGAVLAQGSSAEVARRRSDGTWRSLIDHAIGSSQRAAAVECL